MSSRLVMPASPFSRGSANALAGLHHKCAFEAERGLRQGLPNSLSFWRILWIGTRSSLPVARDPCRPVLNSGLPCTFAWPLSHSAALGQSCRWLPTVQGTGSLPCFPSQCLTLRPDWHQSWGSQKCIKESWKLGSLMGVDSSHSESLRTVVVA